MFKVAILKSGNRARYFLQHVAVGSLHEAELMALELAAKHFEGTDVMIVHKGGLRYDIFEVGEPLGQIKITTA